MSILNSSNCSRISTASAPYIMPFTPALRKILQPFPSWPPRTCHRSAIALLRILASRQTRLKISSVKNLTRDPGESDSTMTTKPSTLPFDLIAAQQSLAACDPRLKALIDEMIPFEIDISEAQSPYEALLESIAYQSISGKAAATIYGRVKALGSNGRAPTPQEMLRLPPRKLRKAGLSGAKVLAMKDLAKKTVDGIVPTLEQAQQMSDEELVERLDSVRGIGAWTVEMFLIFN